MSFTSDKNRCDQAEVTYAYALQILAASEVAAAQAHLSGCPDCRSELAKLRPIVDAFVYWPTDVLRPTEALWERLIQRIAAETSDEPSPGAARQWVEPQWQNVAPGISCQLLATDTQKHRVSMLVRLAPGVEYPPHLHDGVEELHLLHGELTIDDRKLYPGDYNRAEPGSADKRVWSETGCTCVLITSPRDVLVG